ncbi:MAG: hypothetical protein L0Y58_23440 [Verrucomicrobia subdivision 3 bacterium]|nr:hypothetical protein [Limisphaerales bacterium]
MITALLTAGIVHVASQWTVRWDWICIAGVVSLGLAGATKAIAALSASPNDQAIQPPLKVIPAAEERRVTSEPTVMIEEIRSEHLRREKALTGQLDRIQDKLESLQAQAFEEMQPADLLESASSEERANLTKILGLLDKATTAETAVALCKAGSHSVAAWLRGVRGHEQFVAYREVVADVARKLGSKKPASSATVADLERTAIGAAIDQMLASATPELRAALLGEIAKSQKQTVKGIASATGGLVAANLSGFGLYVAASTAVGAIAGVLGVTLPFAAYTGMSSILATVIGPLGWAALAGWATFKLGSTNYKKTVPGVLALAAARARLIAERDQEIGKLISERETKLATEQKSLSKLRRFLDELSTKPGIRDVPKARVPLVARRIINFAALPR